MQRLSGGGMPGMFKGVGGGGRGQGSCSGMRGKEMEGEEVGELLLVSPCRAIGLRRVCGFPPSMMETTGCACEGGEVLPAVFWHALPNISEGADCKTALCRVDSRSQGTSRATGQGAMVVQGARIGARGW